jgi:hypothetical protein
VITILTGWNWYTGSNAAVVGTNQYDFETIVLHELGHALGLGHSSDSTSVMYATLNLGVAKRALTTADLAIPDSNSGPCGLHAASLAGLASSHAAAIPGGGSPVFIALPVPSGPSATGEQAIHRRVIVARRDRGRSFNDRSTARTEQATPPAAQLHAAMQLRAADAIVDAALQHFQIERVDNLAAIVHNVARKPRSAR